MSTAEELLCSRKWRLARGLWMLLGWVPFGWAAWVGYLIIGVKARNWKWLAIAAGFLAYTVTTFSIMGSMPRIEKGESYPEPYNVISALVMWPNLIIWIGNAAGLQWWINRKWLVWRAHNNTRISTPWYATATASRPVEAPVEQGQVTAVIDNALANAPGTIRATLTTPAPRPPTASGTSYAPPLVSKSPIVLDINLANSEQLASLPGLDAHTAAQVVAARDGAGGFRDTTDLVTRAGVKPHIFAALEGHIFVSAATSVPVAHPAVAPPVPGSEHGRRLEF